MSRSASRVNRSPLRRLFEVGFHIRPDEFGVVQMFFLHFTLIGVFYTLGATAADTMFLSRFDPERVKALLPWVYVGTAGISTLLTWFYDVIQGRVSRLKLLTGTHLILGISVFVFRYLIAEYRQLTWLYFVFVIWLESCALISIMMFYSYAGDYFTTRAARRLYGYINGGLAFGTLLSGYMVTPLVRQIGTDNLLPVIGGLQVLSALWAALISRFPRPAGLEETEVGRQPRAPLRTIFGRPYVLATMLVVIAGLVCFRLTEFQFLITASRAMQEETLAIFFGRFYGYVGIAQVLIQFLLVGWLLGRFGVIKSLAVLPVCLLGTSAGFYFHPVVLTAALMNFARLAFSETLDLPSREALFLPLPRRIRLRAQAVFSGAVVPFGSGVGGAVILILVRHLEDLHRFAAVTAAVVVVWIAGLLILRPLYNGTLAQSITARDVGPVDLQRLVSLPGSGAVLNGLLRSDRTERVLLALDLLESRKLGFLVDQVCRLTGSPDERIAAKAFELLRKEGAGVPMEHFERGLADRRPAVRAAAILAYARVEGEGAVPGLIEALEDRDTRCRLAAMTGLIRHGGFDGSIQAFPRLQEMLESRSPADRAAAASAIRHIGGRGYERTITSLLNDRSRGVRSQAAETSARLGLAELVPALVERLRDPAVRDRIVRALASMPPEAAPAVAGFIRDGSLRIEDRASLAVALAGFGRSRDLDVLSDLVRSGEPVLLRAAAARALRIARQRGAQPKIDAESAHRCLDRLSGDLALVGRARTDTCTTDPRSSRLFLDRFLVLLQIVFSLLLLLTDREELKGIESNLLSPDASLRDNAVELLDAILPRRLSSRIIPPINTALHQLPQESGGLADETRSRLLESDDWLRCVTLFHLRAKRTRQTSTKGAENMSDNDLRLLAIVDTVSFLKTVDLFEDIPAEYLTSLAEIAEQVSFFANETLFKEGQRGDSCYLVEEGRIGVKKGRKVVTKLGRGECIGEMALLDGKPRSATCIVEKDARLLRISSDDFSSLLSSQPEMAKALLRTLAQRLRRVTDRL